MDTEIKAIIKEALDLKRASVKRAMTGAKPAFKELHEKELEQVTKAHAYIDSQK